MLNYLDHPLEHVGKRQVRDRHVLLPDHKRTLRGDRKRDERSSGDRLRSGSGITGEAPQTIKHVSLAAARQHNL